MSLVLLMDRLSSFHWMFSMYSFSFDSVDLASKTNFSLLLVESLLWLCYYHLSHSNDSIQPVSYLVSWLSFPMILFFWKRTLRFSPRIGFSWFQIKLLIIWTTQKNCDTKQHCKQNYIRFIMSERNIHDKTCMMTLLRLIIRLLLFPYLSV